METLGLCYVSACLKQAGYSCGVLDPVEEAPSAPQLAGRIAARAPRLLVGFSAHCGNVHATLRVIRSLRKQGLKVHVTAGGIGASLEYEALLRRCGQIDSVVVGDGERTAVALARALDRGAPLVRIAGLASRGGKGEIRFIPRPALGDIDRLPMPDRAHCTAEIRRADVGTLAFSRGCSAHCVFCSIAAYIDLCHGRRRRPRDPVRVVDEVEHIHKQTGAASFLFVDDDFVGPGRANRRRCLLFTREIRRRRLAISFKCTTQAKWLTRDVLEALRDAGLWGVDIGTESWVNSQLRRYGKLSTRADNLRAVDLLRDLGLRFYTYLIPLDPYATRPELRSNLRQIRRLGLGSVYGVDFCKRLMLDRHCLAYRRCLADGLTRKPPRRGRLLGSVPYRQRHADMQEIVRAADEMTRTHTRIVDALARAGHGAPQDAWSGFAKNILEAVQEEFFACFAEMAQHDGIADGAVHVRAAVAPTVEAIMGFCSHLREDTSWRRHGWTVKLLGREISSRLAECYVVPVDMAALAAPRGAAP